MAHQHITYGRAFGLTDTAAATARRPIEVRRAERGAPSCTPGAGKDLDLGVIPSRAVTTPTQVIDSGIRPVVDGEGVPRAGT